MNRYVGIICVIGCLMLTACGGDATPAPETVTTGSETVNQVEIPEDVQSLEPGAFFLEASGGASFASTFSTFTYQTLGDSIYELALTDANAGYSVVLRLYGVPESGDYPLQSYDAPLGTEAPFAVGLFSLTSPQASDRFTSGVNGTINFVVIENAITASFNFSANSDGGSASVRGGFRDLPVPG